MKRLSPILMTALVTGIGLLPLALGKGEPGKEIQRPMAIVILGGIVTSTFLNIIVIPALYLKYGRVEATGETSTLPLEQGDASIRREVKVKRIRRSLPQLIRVDKHRVLLTGSAVVAL